MSETATMIVIDFDRAVMQHLDVPQWNAFVAFLLDKDLVPPMWMHGERPPPLAVTLDLHGLRRAHYVLDAIDLRMAWLADADFSFGSLVGARLGCCPRANFKSARLHGADFRGVEISGCDFTDAKGLDAVLFEGAAYDLSCPPMGLPPQILARCKAEAAPSPTGTNPPSNPTWPSGLPESPLKCLATVYTIPLE